MVSAGDIVELGPGCGPAFTGRDRFQVEEAYTSPALPDHVRLVGRWWPPTDNRRIALSVRTSGLRVLAPSEPAASGPRVPLPRLGDVVHLCGPDRAEPGLFRVMSAAADGPGHVRLTGWYLDAADIAEHTVHVPAGAIRPTDHP